MECAQLTLFEVPRLTEAQKLAEVRKRMELERAQDIEHMRRVARWFVYANKGMAVHGIPYTVCMDDVNEEMKIPVLKRHWKNGTENNVHGAIFLKNNWVRVGEVRSKREGSHGNRIGLYTLLQYEKCVLDYLGSQNKQRRA